MSLSSSNSGIQIFSHFSPMLAKGFMSASTGQIEAVNNAMKGNPFVMDKWQ
eukprot:gene16893-22382_t